MNEYCVDDHYLSSVKGAQLQAIRCKHVQSNSTSIFSGNRGRQVPFIWTNNERAWTLTPPGNFECHEIPEKVEGRDNLLRYGLSIISHPSLGTVISGGEFNDTIVHSMDGKNFSSLGCMPSQRYDHCMCAIDGGKKLLITGGAPGINTWLYDTDRKMFVSDLQALTPHRWWPTCGTAKRSDGSEKVVVAGGMDEGYNNNVDIFNVDIRTWRKGAVC